VPIVLIANLRGLVNTAGFDFEATHTRFERVCFIFPGWRESNIKTGGGSFGRGGQITNSLVRGPHALIFLLKVFHGAIALNQRSSLLAVGI
jgi:hypothetical protein